MNREIVTLYRGGVTSTRTWDGVLEEWVPFQGFIGGNLLVTGGVIADHIAADAVDAGKISFVEASGENVRADTLEVQAANVIGRLTASQIDASNIRVNAIRITGTIQATQVQDKLKAPVVLSEGAAPSTTLRLLQSRASSTNLSGQDFSQIITFTSTYDVDDLSRLFELFLFEGFYSMTTPTTFGVPSSVNYFAKYAPVSQLFSSSGAITSGSSTIEIGSRYMNQYTIAGIVWRPYSPVMLRMVPLEISGRGGLGVKIGSDSFGSLSVYTFSRVFGVWKG